MVYKASPAAVAKINAKVEAVQAQHPKHKMFTGRATPEKPFYNSRREFVGIDVAVKEERPGGFYIQMGFCGFNSPSNNSWGYETEAKAAAAIIRYQTKK